MATIVNVDPHCTLAQLNQFVADCEISLQGSLTGIGNINGNTSLTIDDIDPAGAPPNPSLITLGAIPVGATVISTGQVYVAGALTSAIAYRASIVLRPDYKPPRGYP